MKRLAALVGLVVTAATACGEDPGEDPGTDAASVSTADATGSDTVETSTTSGTSPGSTAGSASSTADPSTGPTDSGSSTTDPSSTEADTSDSDTSPVGNGGSFNWVVNGPAEHDYGHQLQIPAGFGENEFSLQLWIKPDASFDVGPTDGDGQLTNWSDADIEPYQSGSWWYAGNFLLDGHNNNTSFASGTFSLQWYGGGRVRWLFGDGGSPSGGVWSAGAWPATTTGSLLDDQWHQLTLVRRWSGDAEADLELWVDGALVDAETSTERTNMRTYWDRWAGFGGAQNGWFWGAEKQAAVGALSQYEDYKGMMAELRFWDRAMSPAEISSDYALAVAGDEPGLVGWFPWGEGRGSEACDVLDPSNCVELIGTAPTQWMQEGPPLQ